MVSMIYFFFKKGEIAILKKGNWDFPGGPFVKTLPYNVGSIGELGSHMPQLRVCIL